MPGYGTQMLNAIGGMLPTLPELVAFSVTAYNNILDWVAGILKSRMGRDCSVCLRTMRRRRGRLRHADAERGYRATTQRRAARGGCGHGNSGNRRIHNWHIYRRMGGSYNSARGR